MMMNDDNMVALLRALPPTGFVPLWALACGYGMVPRYARCRFATSIRLREDVNHMIHFLHLSMVPRYARCRRGG